jgi:NAD(P)-dependent dehydrogenase (short-subunit alcohol dehydrogenase family)
MEAGDSVAVAGEVVVVTGASAGVGRATAVEFARQGASKVALLARGRDRLDAARRDVESAGAEALALEVDVADAESVERAAADVEEKLGAIDVWVNNAMATVFSRFLEITPDEFRRATDVTYLGYAWGTLAALRRMRGRNRGTIVQVGSALAYRGIPLQSAYCGAKHAIQGFTESVRCELLHDDIDVHLTMVQLPALNTQFDWPAQGSRTARSRCRPSSSPRSRAGPSSGRPGSGAGSSSSASRPRRRSSATRSRRGSPICIWRAQGSRRNRRTSRSGPAGGTTCSSPLRATSVRAGASTPSRTTGAGSSG